VIERQLDRYTVRITPQFPQVVVREGVHVIALFEHPPGGAERVHLSQSLGPFS
jgi:hypothetical protein